MPSETAAAPRAFPGRVQSWLPLLLLPVILTACGDDAVQPPPDNPPTITLTAPAGGVAVAPGGKVDIAWTVVDAEGGVTVDLTYTADGGKSGSIATAQSGTSFSWTVPSQVLYGVKVKAVARDKVGQTATAETKDIFAVVASSARGYVTSVVCKDCHADNYKEVLKSGHPYKVNKVVGAKAPTYPFTAVASPPTGFAWKDITYVIGGYGWKARFMDKDGYVLTNGLAKTNVQDNIARPDLGYGQKWGSYETAATAPKLFDCGSCHTTGWQTLAQNGGRNQDGLKGIAGTWEEPGIMCEQCHGAGATHVATKTKASVKIDKSKDLCGSCHMRDAARRIVGQAGFIQHRPTMEEMLATGHKNQNCVTCHEPHLGVLHGLAAKGGIRTTCESCHASKTTTRHAFPLDCESCHMPYAAKSAQNMGDFVADLRSHLFKINTDSVGKAAMFYNEGATVLSRPFVTLDFACYSCHKDPATGQGGLYSAIGLGELSRRAKGIHK